MTTTTLLEMTKDILTSMDGDEITSINDTVEATSVANIIKMTYKDLFGLIDFPERNGFFELVETSSATPTMLSLPTTATSLEWVKYDNKLTTDTIVKYRRVEFLEFTDFIERMHTTVSGELLPNVFSYQITVGTDTLDVIGFNDRFPTFYTTYNDSTILFDNYKVSEDTFLKKTKTLCFGLLSTSFTVSDAFVLPLDERQVSLLFNEAKSQAFIELKQTTNPKAEQRAKRALIGSQRTKEAIRPGPATDRTPDYGRRPR